MDTPGTDQPQAGQRVSLTVTVPWRIEHLLSLVGGVLVCGIAGLSTWQYLYFPAWFIWQGLLLVALWWLGLGCMIFSMDDLRQRWQISADATQLTVQRHGLLGQRRWHWLRQQVVAVAVQRQSGSLLGRQQLLIRWRPEQLGDALLAADLPVREHTLLHHGRAGDLERVCAAIGRAWNI